MVGNGLSTRVLDRHPGALGVLEELSRSQPQQVAVAVTVQLDPVTGGDDLRHQRRAALDLLADQEEGRSRVRLAQDLQHDWRALRMRAVVEGERHARGAILTLRYSQL